MTVTRMVRRGLRGLAVTAVVVGLGAAPAIALSARRELSPRITVKGTALKSSDKAGSQADPAIGKTAPTLTGVGFDGQKVTFANDGKPRILLFLAHWCPHCQAEVPRIVKLAEQGKLDGVEIDTVATNTDKNYPNYPPSKWLKREKWPFSPVLLDDSHARALLAYGGDGFPYFVLIDASGHIVARTSGELAPSAIAEAARRLAAGESLFGT